MSVQSLKSSKLRSALTSLGIIIGIAAVVITFSFGASYNSYFETQVVGMGNNFIVIIATKENVFRNSHLQIIESTPGISGVSPALTVNGELEFMGKTKSVQINGVSSEMMEVANLEMLEGKFIADSDKYSAVLSKQVARDNMKTEIKPRNFVNLIIPDESDSGRKKSYRFKVKGIQGLEEEGIVVGHNMNTVYVPIDVLRELSGNESFNMFFAMADSQDEISNVSKEVEKRLGRSIGIPERDLEKNITSFNIINQADVMSIVSSLSSVLQTFLVGLGSISLLVGSVGIMNIMLVTVTERTSEIGLMKAIGYTKSDILFIFLTESAILSVSGGIVGTIIGLIFAYFGMTLIGMGLNITLFTVSIGIIVSFLIGIIAGVYPAYRAAQMDPVVSLRKE